MFPRMMSRSLYLQKILFSCRNYSDKKDPLTKTWRILANDVPNFFGKKKSEEWYPEHADIVIIGGGFIGSSVAYWLKTRAGEGLSVVVFEKDLSYTNAQKYASRSVLTQHYSLPENILMSKYSAEFLRNIREHLNSEVDIQYCPMGSLVLASEKYADKLEENITLQKEYGIRNHLLTVQEINKLYPWIQTHDVKLGSMGYESEGTFDSWALLKGLITKSKQLGTTFVNAEVTGFEMEQQRDVLMEGIAPGSFQRMNKVKFKSADGQERSTKFAICILAAAENSADIAKLAKIGTSDGLLRIPLPIASREQKMYSVAEKATKTGLNTPMLMDTTGLWLRRNGLENNLLFGHVPLLADEAKHLTESEFYRNIIRPSLLNRIPICKNEEVVTFGTEIYDYNTYDDTGIMGPHPYHNNLYIAAGFGKLGCQHAPALGRAITELIVDSQFMNIDLTRLGFDRLIIDDPLVEFNLY